MLDALLEGKSNAEIADALGISQDGAKWHVGQLLGETGLDDRRELADWWRSQRERVEARGFLGGLLGLGARLAMAAPVVALAVWLVAYDPLHVGRGPEASASLPAATAPATATALPSPAPSVTPAPAGAWIFDLRSGIVTPIYTANFNMRWLDEGHLLTQAGSRPIVVDSAGAVVRELPANAAAMAFPGKDGKVLLLDNPTFQFSELDIATGQQRPLVALGPPPTATRSVSSRTWAISPAGDLLALAEAKEDGEFAIEVMRMDGSGRTTVWAEPPDAAVGSIVWSPDSSRLLVILTARRAQTPGAVEEPREALVIDPAGRVLLRQPTDSRDARWLGSSSVYFPNGAGAAQGARLTAVIDVPGGAIAPGTPSAGLLCFSPDGRYAVYANTASGRAAGHRVVDLRGGQTVLENPTRTEVSACDWTPDSTRVVLSFGGK